MIAPLLLAVLLQAPAPPPVRHVRLPDNVRVSLVAYCDVYGQPTVILSNEGATPVLVEWENIAGHKGSFDDWRGLDLVAPGTFEGWQTTQQSSIFVTVAYQDDDGPFVQRVGVACP